MNNDIYRCSFCGEHVSHLKTDGKCKGPEMNKSREWWIIDSKSIGLYAFNAPTKRTDEVHVIEKSAYDELLIKATRMLAMCSGAMQVIVTTPDDFNVEGLRRTMNEVDELLHELGNKE